MMIINGCLVDDVMNLALYLPIWDHWGTIEGYRLSVCRNPLGPPIHSTHLEAISLPLSASSLCEKFFHPSMRKRRRGRSADLIQYWNVFSWKKMCGATPFECVTCNPFLRKRRDGCCCSFALQLFYSCERERARGWKDVPEFGAPQWAPQSIWGGRHIPKAGWLAQGVSHLPSFVPIEHHASSPLFKGCSRPLDFFTPFSSSSSTSSS